MGVSDSIRPNSRLRLRDIFGVRSAPVAWSLDAPSLRPVRLPPESRGALFSRVKGRCARFRGKSRNSTVLRSKIARDANGRLIGAIGAATVAIAPPSRAVKASDPNHPRTGTNTTKGLV
jgi:hypothetical protein